MKGQYMNLIEHLLKNRVTEKLVNMGKEIPNFLCFLGLKGPPTLNYTCLCQQILKRKK